MFPPGAVVIRLIVVLAALVLFSSAAYIQIMFDGALTSWKIIEALNYSAQTVTSVGYGNWVPTWWKESDEGFHRRIILMKMASVPFALIGAGFFAFMIGLFTNSIFDYLRRE